MRLLGGGGSRLVSSDENGRTRREVLTVPGGERRRRKGASGDLLAEVEVRVDLVELVWRGSGARHSDYGVVVSIANGGRRCRGGERERGGFLRIRTVSIKYN